MGKGGHLGELEQMLLWAVLRLRGEGFGTKVMRELEERSGRVVTRGTLYLTLDRLEAKGYLTSRTGDPTPGRGGRPRRYVSITEAGLVALQKSRESVMRMWEGIETAPMKAGDFE